MNFHDRPGWGIALRIVLVILLIGGMVWITRAAFYKGVAVGAGNMGPGYMMFSGNGDRMDFHHQEGFHGGYGESEGMFFHHPGNFGHHSGSAGPMGHYSGSSHVTGFFHLLFGALGFFLLVKLIFGFSGMGMHRYGPMGWGPGGRGYHPGHYRHHRCYCPECSGEGEEPAAAEKAPETKSKKKSA